jgi:DNA-binding NarL/FixJ family response regulator
MNTTTRLREMEGIHNGHDQRQSSSRMIRLLIVDHAPTRTGIRLALGPDVEICAEVGDAEQAIRAAMREKPDVALVGTGISPDWQQTVRGICRAAPGCAVVVLAQVEDAEDLIESVRAGAVGYVPGALDATYLRRVFYAVTHNEAVVPRGLVGELLSELRTGGAGGDSLTGREAQVLGMLRRGHSTARIAERLQIAPVTVRRHISELVRKFGVTGRGDLMEQAPLGPGAAAADGPVTPR